VVDRVRLVADRRAEVSEVDVGVLAIAGGGAGALGCSRAGAIPQRSQYPSTISPVHPGCEQFTAEPPMTTGSR
jgi:hypothetical protein